MFFYLYKFILFIFKNYDKKMRNFLVKTELSLKEMEYQIQINTILKDKKKTLKEFFNRTQTKLDHLDKLEKKLELAIERTNGAENLYSVKVLKINEVSNILQKISSEVTTLHVLSSEMKRYLQEITQTNDFQEIIDKNINKSILKQIGKSI